MPATIVKDTPSKIATVKKPKITRDSVTEENVKVNIEDEVKNDRNDEVEEEVEKPKKKATPRKKKDDSEDPKKKVTKKKDVNEDNGDEVKTPTKAKAKAAPKTPKAKKTPATPRKKAVPKSKEIVSDDDENELDSDEGEDGIEKPSIDDEEEEDTSEKAAATPRKKRQAFKNVQYTDTDGVVVPKRKEKLTRLFDVYAVRHNEPINLDEHETVCMTDWNPRLVARDFCLEQMIKKDKKATGRRDIYVKERGINSIKTYGYTVRRRRVPEKSVKKVTFPGKNSEPAQFNFDVKLKHARVNKKNLKSFKQQIMRRAGLSEEDIDAVVTEDEKVIIDKETKEVIPDSDSSDEEDAPEPKPKTPKMKKAEAASEEDVGIEIEDEVEQEVVQV